jgi:hypothetical protein
LNFTIIKYYIWRREIAMDKEREISLIAYNLWQEGNCSHGQDCDHWMQAELIWEGQQKPPASVIRNKTKATQTSKKTRKNTS